MSRFMNSTPASYRYDRETGQTFREWLGRPCGRSPTDWYRMPPPLPAPKKPEPGKRGVRGLVDMAIDVLSQNLHTLEVGDLDGVPYHIACRIWDRVTRENGIISLHLYMILATHITKTHREHFPSQPLPSNILQFRYFVKEPTEPLSAYTGHLTSNSFEFIVHLTLAHDRVTFGTHELLGLTQMKNLGVLEILYPCHAEDASKFPRVNDSVIRHWSEQPDPFPLLRVLRIWGTDFTTATSLKYIHKFPALAVYDVSGRSRDWSTRHPDDRWHWHRVDPSKDLFDPMFDHFYRIYPSASPPSLKMIWESLIKESAAPSEHGCDDKLVRIEDRETALTSSKPAKSVGRYRGWLSEFGGSLCLHFLSYLLYCHVGRAWSDKDLVALGLCEADKAFVMDGYHFIPPRPFVTLNLGHCCDHVLDRSSLFGCDKPSCPCEAARSSFEMHYTFVRLTKYDEIMSSPVDKSSSKNDSSTGSSSSHKMRKKRKRFVLEDL